MLGTPRTDGTTIVWDLTGNNETGGIWAARVDDFKTYRIVPPDLNPRSPDIDGNILVWSSAGQDYTRNDIMGKRLDTGEEFTISDSLTNLAYVYVSGRFVVWINERNHVQSLLVRDLETMAEPVVVASSNNSIGFAVDGTHIAWAEYKYDGSGHRDLYVTTLDSDRLTNQRIATDIDMFGMDLADDLLVYTSGHGIETINLDTSERHHYGELNALYFSTDGQRIVWWDTGGTSPNGPGIISYDLLSGEQTTVAANAGSGEPFIRNGVLVWRRMRYGGHGTFSGQQIFAVVADSHLPSSRQEPPTEEREQSQYFPETGQYLNLGFKNYWDANGALPVFGYPLTEEFQEFNADTEDVFTVQYFERQRFEWHPENADTPYVVLLGRLGAQALESQGRNWMDFPKADPSAPNYFSETGHAIAPQFLEYWSSHGLEFGDVRTSYRESLALFGYPISEPMTETNADGDTVLTQYFERAVFEYHPEVGVLLRRVGAEMLSERGW
jgi:hypothetical protein